ncbi:formin-F-like [Aphis craccivora]|uniref:Formin-F-like n=1 Tax=Aphis craccivora TaxID=307492 RepID=A0A6G0WAZ0_APHCR|nr:formin-F-like [Aphis craccivora]
MVSEDPDIAVRAKLPPPIFMKGINYFPGFCTSLIELIEVDNFICKATADCLKIQTANPESYRLLIHYPKEHNAK